MGKTYPFTQFYPILPKRFYPVGKTYHANPGQQSLVTWRSQVVGDRPRGVFHPATFWEPSWTSQLGKGQDDLGRICVRYTCYMTKQGTDRPLTLEILDWRQLERLRCGWSLTTWCRVFGVASACGMLQVCATRRMSASTSRSHTVTPTYTTAVNPKFRGIADMSITPNPT